MDPSHGSPGPSNEQLPSSLAIHILGSLRVRRGGAVLGAHQLGGPKPRHILEILLLHLGTPVSKERLIELLWQGRPPAEAFATLETYVCVLRRHLQPGGGRTGALQTVNGGYVIETARVDLDLARFDGLFLQARQSGAREALPLLREALALASAPLLGDELIPLWAAEERAIHAARVTTARILAADCALSLNRTEEAVGWANLALTEDPLNERAWTALILGLEQAGRHAEGLQAYESYRRMLDHELGCTPGGVLQATQVRLLQATGDGELSDVIAALLVLHDQLRRATGGRSGTSPAPRPLPAPESLREAGNILDSFLRRVRIST